MKTFVRLALSILVFCSCRGSVSEQAEDLYALYVAGDYAEYVDNTHSCMDKPAEYREQMVALHRQHAEEQKRRGKSIEDFSVGGVSLYDDGKMANVFLHINYSDSTTEKILFPIVFADGRWWAQ